MKLQITFPDRYTNACCSHPLHDIEGEQEELNVMGIRRAAQRRLNYELGIPYNQVREIERKSSLKYFQADDLCDPDRDLSIFRLNSQARPENFHYLTRIHYKDIGDGVWGEHEIDYILFLQKDVDLTPNPSEVSEAFYIKRENLDR